MKQSLLYEQTSCRLQVDGLPDVSAGNDASSIGIITGWTLRWAGRPDLEGRREHLLALMQVVLPYARHLISEVSRSFGDAEQPVSITPGPDGLHQLSLRSSQSGVEPLRLTLDDAELADLVQVLDRLRHDPRLQLDLDLPASRPLRPRELSLRVPLSRRLAAPLGGLAALMLAAGVGTLLPLPRPQPSGGGSGSGALSTSSSSTKTSSSTGSSNRTSSGNSSSPDSSNTAASSSATKSSATNSSDSNSAARTNTNPPPETSTRPEGGGPDATEELINRLHAQLGRNAQRHSLRRIRSDQTWMLAVDRSGAVVAATPYDVRDNTSATDLGLPQRSVSRPAPSGTTLVRGDLRSSGYWELAPWDGWGSQPPQR